MTNIEDIAGTLELKSQPTFGFYVKVSSEEVKEQLHEIIGKLEKKKGDPVYDASDVKDFNKQIKAIKWISEHLVEGDYFLKPEEAQTLGLGVDLVE